MRSKHLQKGFWHLQVKGVFLGDPHPTQKVGPPPWDQKRLCFFLCGVCRHLRWETSSNFVKDFDENVFRARPYVYAPRWHTCRNLISGFQMKTQGLVTHSRAFQWLTHPFQWALHNLHLRYLHATINRECNLLSKLTFLRFSGGVLISRFLTHFGGHLKKNPNFLDRWELWVQGNYNSCQGLYFVQ